MVTFLIKGKLRFFCIQGMFIWFAIVTYRNWNYTPGLNAEYLIFKKQERTQRVHKKLLSFVLFYETAPALDTSRKSDSKKSVKTQENKKRKVRTETTKYLNNQTVTSQLLSFIKTEFVSVC